MVDGGIGGWGSWEVEREGWNMKQVQSHAAWQFTVMLAFVDAPPEHTHTHTHTLLEGEVVGERALF